MGQLILRYRGNPHLRELRLPIQVSQREREQLRGLPLVEIEVEGKVFIEKGETDACAQKQQKKQ